jgi:hypothetical protein
MHGELTDDIRLLKSRPENTTAILVNGNGKATRHRYSHTIRVEVPVVFEKDGGVSTEIRSAKHFVFLCEETDEPRVYGCE